MKISQVRAPRGKIWIPREALEDPDSVPKGENFLWVRGLNLFDASALMHVNAADMDELWGSLVPEGEPTIESLAQFDFLSLARVALDKTPTLAAHIITLGLATESKDMEDADSVIVVGELPASVQIDALGEIARLTFYSEEQVGKIWAVFVAGSRAMKTVVGLVAASASASLSGTGDSGKA